MTAKPSETQIRGGFRHAPRLPGAKRGDVDPPHLWWQALSRTADSRAIRSYLAFLIIVPFVVTIIQMLPGTLPLRLPLSWLLGYAAGICFFLGSTIVALRCPRIIGTNFRQMQEEGRTIQYLFQELRALCMDLGRSDRSRALYLLEQIILSDDYVENASTISPKLESLRRERVDSFNRNDVWDVVEMAQFRPNIEQEMFWTVQWFAGTTHPLSRSVCFYFFVGGGMFALAILIYQCYFVVSFAMGEVF